MKTRINFLLLLGIATCGLLVMSCGKGVSGQTVENNTFCNPLNIDYRFSEGAGSHREAADPTIILFQDDYYLFASKSGGYWWSSDFREWNFVKPTGVDIEKYAPSAWIIDGVMYYTSSSSGDIYKSADPKGGQWEYVSHPHDWNDPWVFVDDDGKVYAYYGCSPNGTIDCVQLDPNNNFAVISDVVHCIYSNLENNGFEVNGNNNEDGVPWTEGPAMFKHNNTYYLTYATPGTEHRSYCDAYYTSKSPMGPFTLGANSPATRKSLGYVTGTGHGGFFRDKAGELWTIVTAVISEKAYFERRLAVFPAIIDEEGYLHSNTVFGDYPQYYPGVSKNPSADNSPGWNLLSEGKVTTASSVHDTKTPSNATDENIKTYWSAVSGNQGEWLKVDLGKVCTVNAVQSNFYESETTYDSGRNTAFSTKYKVEYSVDDSDWLLALDKSTSTQDTPHDYVQLTKPISARYIKITNMGEIPGYGYFALTDFRIFGNGNGKAPVAVSKVNVERQADERHANVSWEPVPDADGYIIRYGIAPDKLWNHYQVWSNSSFPIRSLIVGQAYYFRIDAYNENGITEGEVIL